MTTAEWITASLVFIIAAILAVVSIRSFQNKGFLFNNAYIYASKEERGKMDKKPYYRQSAIVFCILSAVFTSLFFDVHSAIRSYKRKFV